MTNTREDQALSPIELLVLARLSSSEPPTEDELAASVAEFAPPDGPPSLASELAANAIAELRRRALMNTPRPTKRAPRPKPRLSEEGRRLLRMTFGLGKTPSWTDVSKRHIPALALKFQLRSEQASKLGQSDALTVAVLVHHLENVKASTMITLCDALIAKQLGLPPGPKALLRARAHVLTRTLDIDAKVESGKDLAALATRVAMESLGERSDSKRTLRQALFRRWAYQVVAPPNGSRPVSVQRTTPFQVPLSLPLEARTNVAPLRPHPPTAPANVISNARNAPAALAASADTLLALVRETIPRIGSDGRFGAEKVFVSAIWRRLEGDDRLPNLSLDRFKGWLVTANRERLIDLARADTLGDMDDKLVEESEIRDRGATFHFVVDRRLATVGRGLHAR